MARSVSFDRAADYYDATRATDDAALARILEVLTREMSARVLEIGVGTGQIAVPLAACGVDVTGLDLSAEMMAQLRAKRGGATIPLARGDATRLPFPDGTFGGAYARWVLHLIPDWERALDELIRVTAPAAAIAIEPGGVGGIYREIFLRYQEILGGMALVPGLQPVDRGPRLDEAMAARGWRCDRTEPVTYDDRRSLRVYFDQVPLRQASWTWSVPEPVLTEATAEVRAWAATRYDLDEPRAPVPTAWHVYRRAAVR